VPAVSQKQQRLFAIAEHDPSKLYAKNKGLLGMSRLQLHDFAATPRTGLPTKAGGLRSAAKKAKEGR
jgi:hypothetical protein